MKIEIKYLGCSEGIGENMIALPKHTHFDEKDCMGCSFYFICFNLNLLKVRMG